VPKRAASLVKAAAATSTRGGSDVLASAKAGSMKTLVRPAIGNSGMSPPGVCYPSSGGSLKKGYAWSRPMQSRIWGRVATARGSGSSDVDTPGIEPRLRSPSVAIILATSPLRERIETWAVAVLFPALITSTCISCSPPASGGYKKDTEVARGSG